MKVGRRKLDPLTSFQFALEDGGIVVGDFTEISGLSAEIEVEEYKEGGQNEFSHKLGGPMRFPPGIVSRPEYLSANARRTKPPY